MEQSYKIIGVQSENGFKKLKLKPMENQVEEKKPLNVMAALKDINGFVSQTTDMFSKTVHIDMISVPDEVYKSMGLMIDGMFTISY